MAYIFKLAQQSDVGISSPANNDILQYNTSTGKWENHVLSALSLYSLTVDNTALTLDSGTTYNPGSAARTISHATGAGYKHLPSNTTATNWLKGSATDGLGVWTAPATLTVAAGVGLTIGGSTTGTYDINTTKAIAVDWTQVQAKLTNPVTGTGTQWQIAYWGSTSAITGSANFTIDTSGNVTCGQNLTITGDFTVNGTTVTVNTSTLSVKDPLIALATTNVTDVVDVGFYGKYQPAATPLWGGLFRDASDGVWKFFKDVQAEPTTTVNEAATGYAYATIKAYGAIFTAPAGSSASTNYVTWNASTGALEYRSLPSYDNYQYWSVNALDSATGLYNMVTTNSLAIIGDSAAISTALASGSILTKKITITHATTTGYKHIPTSGATSNYLQYASDGTAQWAAFAALTVDNSILLLDSGSTYTPTTARTISHATTTGYKHVPTGGSSGQILNWSSDGTAAWGAVPGISTMITGSLTAGRVTLSSGTYAVTDDATLTFDTTNDVFYQNCGQRWARADKTAAYTLLASDFVITTSGATSFTITIPTALFANIGQVWIIKVNGTGTITLDPEGTQTIDGAAAYVSPGQYTSVIIQIQTSTTISIL